MNRDEISDKEGDSGAGMRALDPRLLWVLRIRTAIVVAILLAGAWGADLAPLREFPIPAGLVPGAVAILGLAALLILPGRRYRAWSYREDPDELHVRHGLMVRLRTIIPFGRVQHIDLAQGPLERAFGLATLILHTAGTRGSAVRLPGLAVADAETMRDRIRALIRQDLI